MAPEMLLDRPYDAQKADVWSFAIMYCCMILGRFPWKVAALYDEAFKLFATTKRPNFHAERGMGRRSTEPASLQASNNVAATPCDSVAENMDTVSMMNISFDKAADANGAERVLEPCRLLRQLPSNSSAVIGKMLLLNANSRPTLEQISDDPWIQQSQLCSQDDGRTIHYGSPHEHVLRRG
jgi:serine/threonine protein kinase